MKGFDPRVSVVFPSYNEKDNIVEAIGRASKALGKNLFEIIVVDDNSPDGTWKIVENLKNPKVRLIRRMAKGGLASAHHRGIHEAKGNIIVWLDCDLGIPPEVIPRLVEKLEHYDVAIGSRYAGGGEETRPWWRALLSTCINHWARLFMGSKVKDYTSGFAAVRREVFDRIDFTPEGFGEYFIEFCYKCIRNKFRIIEVGYSYGARKGGLSKSDGNKFVLIKLGLQYALKVIKWRFTI